MFAGAPRWFICDRSSGFNEALVIASDLRRQPFGAGTGADHRKNRWRSHYLAFAGFRVLQFDFLKFLIAGHSSNLRAVKDLNVVLCLHAAGQVIGHFARDVVAANNEHHFLCAVRKKHRGLTRRVAAAHHNHGFIATNLSLERRRRIINSNAFEFFPVVSFKPAVVCAGCNQNGFCAQNCGTTFDLDTGAILVVRIVFERERLGRGGKFCAEAIRL